MSDFTTKYLLQKALYWGNPQNQGDGTYLYDDPIEINTRWEAVTMTDLAALGVDTNVRSEVYVDRDVEEQGMLLLGELVDLDSDEYNDPQAAGAFLITRFDKIPSIRADKYIRKAYVGRLWTGKT